MPWVKKEIPRLVTKIVKKAQEEDSWLNNAWDNVAGWFGGGESTDKKNNRAHKENSVKKQPLTKAELKSISSWEKELENHKAKLEEFIKNPDAFDNKNFLKNAPNTEVRQKIIDGRIKHLKNEIGNFEKQISRLKHKEKIP